MVNNISQGTSEEVSLKGLMGLVKKSKITLSPLFEAITNSLEAISEKKFENGEVPFINVTFHFTGLHDETKDLNSIIVEDNGIGFNSECYTRYKMLLDKSKGFNNRGSGRIQYLHNFNSVEVTSVFSEDGKFNKRTFTSNDKGLVQNHQVEMGVNEKHSVTTIKLLDYIADKNTQSFDDINIDDIKNEIKNKLLLKLYLEKKKGFIIPTISIFIFKNNKSIGVGKITPNDIPQPQSEDTFEISYVKLSSADPDKIEWTNSPKKEKLKWAHFVLPQNELAQNGVFLCSKNVPVDEVNFLKIKKSEIFNGNRYLTVIYGDVLDKESNLSDSVDKFLIPSQKEIEKEIGTLYFDKDEEFLFMENIQQGVKNILPSVYSDIEDLKEQHGGKIIEIAQSHGISEDMIKGANIDLSDNEEKITDKLFKRQAEVQAKNSLKIKKLYESLTELNPTKDNYKSELEEKSKKLLALIPQQNKEELGRYVIRREMVTTVLKLILDQKLEYQKEENDTKTSKGKKKRKDKEGLVHDLIFKRRTKENNGLNDLWILNEEFLHFDGCSEIALSEIKNKNEERLLKGFDTDDNVQAEFGIKRRLRRPDIFLYLEEGKCVLVEFKQPEVDLSDHLNQMVRYCNLIANCSNEKIEQFYCFLIGNNIARVDLPGEFRKSVNGGYVSPAVPVRAVGVGDDEKVIGYVYQEIIQLSSLHERAFIRNKSFADKLGIRLKEENQSITSDS